MFLNRLSRIYIQHQNVSYYFNHLNLYIIEGYFYDRTINITFSLEDMNRLNQNMALNEK